MADKSEETADEHNERVLREVYGWKPIEEESLLVRAAAKIIAAVQRARWKLAVWRLGRR